MRGRWTVVLLLVGACAEPPPAVPITTHAPPHTEVPLAVAPPAGPRHRPSASDDARWTATGLAAACATATETTLDARIELGHSDDAGEHVSVVLTPSTFAVDDVIVHDGTRAGIDPSPFRASGTLTPDAWAGIACALDRFEAWSRPDDPSPPATGRFVRLRRADGDERTVVYDSYHPPTPSQRGPYRPRLTCGVSSHAYQWPELVEVLDAAAGTGELTAWLRRLADAGADASCFDAHPERSYRLDVTARDEGMARIEASPCLEAAARAVPWSARPALLEARGLRLGELTAHLTMWGRAPAPPTSPSGTLRINTRPSSEVWIDGTRIGPTPQLHIALAEGEHTVTLVNPEYAIRESITVEIHAGETESRSLTLAPGASR